MKPNARIESFRDPSLAELEARRGELMKLSDSLDQEVAEAARGKLSALLAEFRYREARMKGDGPVPAARHLISLAVSEPLFLRLEGRVRRTRVPLQDILLEAVGRELDRLERRDMAEAVGEGREGILNYRKKRRALKRLRA